MQNVCYNCFHYTPEGRACLYCGYDPRENEDKYRIALKPGATLAGRYVIGRVLGQGGFGITYVAFDDQTKSRVAIKEYLPTEYASRDEGTMDLKLNSSSVRTDYEYGKEQFLAEAKTLAEFVGNEHIIGIRSLFEANGTAYFAMEFAEGVNLKQYMQQMGRPLRVFEANRILLPIMEALQWVHSKGVVHRDISPDNIMIKRDGTAKLIDFGAARYSTGEKSKSLDVVLKHGFAPYEQYSRHGRQGPFTDVYAMAATYYYAITGKVPPDAVDRMDEDRLQLPSALGVRIRKETEEVLQKALAVLSRDRYQTMAEFNNALISSMPEPFAPETGTETGQTQAKEAAREKPPSAEKVSPHSTAQPEKKDRKAERTQTKPAENVSRIPAAQTVKRDVAEASPETQKKQESVPTEPKKKKPVAAIAAILAVCVLAGVIFGSGVLGNKSGAAKVGSMITFGSYEQDNNTANGKEPIEWIVLDVQDGKSLLISRYALDCKPYHSYNTSVTWENCSLRKWLNNEFISEAFSAEEKARIPALMVSADKNPEHNTNPGYVTQDQIFLLSIPETNEYFASDAQRQCKASAYAIAQGCYVNQDENCWWWLRTPGSSSAYAAGVGRGGTVSNNGNSVNGTSDAVRPAMWVSLK